MQTHQNIEQNIIYRNQDHKVLKFHVDNLPLYILFVHKNLLLEIMQIF
jgi:hypothetical protein